MRFGVLSALLLTPAIVSAQPGGKTIEIDLSSFKFTPSEPVFEHGQRYVLHLSNTSDGGHDLVAKEFFAAAQVDPADRAKVKDGEVDLKGGASADIHLTAPAAGRYPFHCSHFLHSTFGMTGAMIVK